MCILKSKRLKGKTMTTYSNELYEKLNQLKKDFHESYPRPVEMKETQNHLILIVFNKYRFVKNKSSRKITFYINGKVRKIPDFLNFRINKNAYKNKSTLSKILDYNDEVENFFFSIIDKEYIDSFNEVIIFNPNRRIDICWPSSFLPHWKQATLFTDNYSTSNGFTRYTVQGKKKYKTLDDNDFNDYKEHYTVISEDKGSILFEHHQERFDTRKNKKNFIKIISQDNIQFLKSVNKFLVEDRLPKLIRVNLYDDRKEIYQVYKSVRKSILGFIDEAAIKYFYSSLRVYSESLLVHLDTLINIQNYQHTDIFKYHQKLIPIITEVRPEGKLSINKEINTYADVLDYLNLSKSELKMIEQFSIMLVSTFLANRYNGATQAQISFKIRVMYPYRKKLSNLNNAVLMKLFCQINYMIDFVGVQERSLFLSNLKYERFFNALLDYLPSITVVAQKNEIMYELRDAFDWLLHINNTDFVITKQMSWRNIKERSERWHEVIIEERNNRYNPVYKDWNPVLKNGFEHPNYTVDEITSSKRLQSEGRDLKHCVASYAERCYNGNYSVFSIVSKVDQTERATLGVINNGESFVIDQIRAIGNSKATKEITNLSEDILYAMLQVK